MSEPRKLSEELLGRFTFINEDEEEEVNLLDGVLVKEAKVLEAQVATLEGELKNANFLVEHYNNSFKVHYERAEKAEKECVSLKEQVVKLYEKLKNASYNEFEFTFQEADTHFTKEYWKVRAEAAEVQLDFIKSEYALEKNENLTKDALWLKIAAQGSALSEARKLIGKWDRREILFDELIKEMRKVLD